jgi:hypothetical protein
MFVRRIVLDMGRSENYKACNFVSKEPVLIVGYLRGICH